MRIVAGEWRGRALANVGKGDAGAHLRPTSDRVRESLFSMLQGGRFDDPITNCAVLDLFAGTGALGLEALSRGARKATFVENGRASLALLHANIKSLGANAKVLKVDATRLPQAPETASLVFLDPPYGKDMGVKALDVARSNGWITPGALVIWEESAAQIAPTGFTQIEVKKYGQTFVTILEAS